MRSTYPLNGRVILLVEDDPLIALELVDLCKSAGAQVISARSLGEAAATIGLANISAAVLDYRLGDKEVEPLYEVLRERKIPFFFYSGYGDLQSRYPNSVVVQKPASGAMLLDAIIAMGSTALGSASGEAASSPATHACG
jgi:DNA-binding response OmpR family regulator